MNTNPSSLGWQISMYRIIFKEDLHYALCSAQFSEESQWAQIFTLLHF